MLRITENTLKILRLCSFLKDDIDGRMLKVQMEAFSMQFPVTADLNSGCRSAADFKDIKTFFTNLSAAQIELLSQVVKIFKFILIAPATNAVSERSCSALQRTKTWLRTTMTQERLNNCLILHIHKYLTDEINFISIANEFIAANQSRLSTFGRF